MSASGRLFQEERERHLIEVPDSLYKEHFDLFAYPKTRYIRTIVTADEQMFKDDEVHKGLIKKYKKASKDLRDYEYNKRHNFKK